jgi:Na+/melibiose symporter-like transporter
MGLVRPSDMGMRIMLVGDIVPTSYFVSAIGIQRSSFDASRIVGALAGAGLAATLGMGAAYVVIVALYGISATLTFQARGTQRAARAELPKAHPSPWRELKAGAHYVWTTPILFASMCLAFLINLTAFPLLNGVLPYVAREIYGTTQTGLGYMSAAAGFGALLGSIVASRFGPTMRPARMMVGACVMWFLLLLSFAQTTVLAAGIPFLVAAGFCASMSQVPMQAMILRQTSERFRGRVMGIRMLAIYGNMCGLLASGPLIASLGFRITGSFYCVMGVVVTLLIATRWHEQLWRRDAPANQR